MQGIHASPVSPSSITPWMVEEFQYPVFEPDAGEHNRELFHETVITPWEPRAASSADASTQEEASATEEALPESSERMQALLAEARQQGYEAGRRQGAEEGRITAEEQSHARLSEQLQAADQQRKIALARILEDFEKAREHYQHAIEPEVVRLALAIAARILRREAQMDPLLLTGTVRVALGQIASSSKVQIQVPPADIELWKEAIALLPKLTTRPEIVPGENMRLGDCIIETELGSVDLGVRAQLSEIERGFFDRPGITPAFAESSSEAIA